MNLTSKNAKKTLSESDLHEKWSQDFRLEELSYFYEELLERIARVTNFQPGQTLLDAGCGTGAHAVRLAKFGLKITALDLSEHALSKARQNVHDNGYDDDILLRFGDICDLEYPDGSFDHVFCWGVLMHVPQLTSAISEICRVTKLGGFVILSEGNMHSIQSLFESIKTRIAPGQVSRLEQTVESHEYHYQFNDQKFFKRHINIDYLNERMRQRGFLIRARLPGHFTEIFTKLHHPQLRNIVHFLNATWLKVGGPGLAFGNIVIYQKL